MTYKKKRPRKAAASGGVMGRSVSSLWVHSWQSQADVSRRGINELEKDYMLYYTFLGNSFKDFWISCPVLKENDQI